MDLSLLEKLLASTGLGGFCVGILLVIFKETLRAKFLSKLTKEHSFKIVKTIIWLVWSIAVLGLLSWAGLRIQEIDSSIKKPEITSLINEDVPAKLLRKTFYKEIPDGTQGANVSTAKILLEYVEVVGHSSKIVEKKINETIKGVIGVNEQYDGTEDLSMFLKSASIDGNLLSILVEGTYYGHGAAGAANQIRSINLNIRNGEPIQFKDLFRAGYQEKINNIAKSWFSTQNYESSFEGVKDDQCYYFDGNHLYLCFSEYEVAPGSEGVVNAMINLEEIRGLISLNGPLAYAI